MTDKLNGALTAYGSAAVGKTSHQVYAGHVGLGYYFIDNLALNVESAGYFVDQRIRPARRIRFVAISAGTDDLMKNQTSDDQKVDRCFS